MSDKKTVTITLEPEQVQALERMQAKYGKLASFTSCASACLEVGLEHYARMLSIPYTEKLVGSTAS